jgi:hypothetical protein
MHLRIFAYSSNILIANFDPMAAELPLSACGCKKFALDVLGDHVSTWTAHSGAKKAHDWAFEQLADLFRTTHRVKTQQVAKSGVSDVVTLSLLLACLMLRGRCPWCWTCVLRTSAGEVALTLVLMAI